VGLQVVVLGMLFCWLQSAAVQDALTLPATLSAATTEITGGWGLSLLCWTQPHTAADWIADEIVG
jgi:hypothetical protein